MLPDGGGDILLFDASFVGVSRSKTKENHIINDREADSFLQKLHIVKEKWEKQGSSHLTLKLNSK